MRTDRLAWMILITCSILMTGCGSRLFMFNLNNGRTNIQSAFNTLDEAADVDTTVTLRNVKIRIIGDRDKFLSRYGFERSVRGYVRINPDESAEVFVLGYRQKGKIIVNQAVLGHEINHILSHQNVEIADPDRLDALFE